MGLHGTRRQHHDTCAGRRRDDGHGAVQVSSAAAVSSVNAGRILTPFRRGADKQERIMDDGKFVCRAPIT